MECIRVDWYDVDQADRGTFLDWFHGTYLPALVAVPGVSWAGNYQIVPHRTRAADFPETKDPSVPTGKDFVLLAASATPDVFVWGRSAVIKFEEANAGRLAARKNVRSGVFMEEARVTGPEYRTLAEGIGPPPAMQIGSVNAREPYIGELMVGRYYRESRLPDVIGAEGTIGARKLVAAMGWARHAILYELTSLRDDEPPVEPRFHKVKNGTWEGPSALQMLIHAPGSPHAGRRIWPPVT